MPKPCSVRREARYSSFCFARLFRGNSRASDIQTVVFGAQHVDRAMNNRHIAVFEQIVALDSLTLSFPKRGTLQKKMTERSLI